MTAYGAAPEEGGLDALFESSPDLGVHTSATAESAFVLGLLAAVSASARGSDPGSAVMRHHRRRDASPKWRGAS